MPSSKHHPTAPGSPSWTLASFLRTDLIWQRLRPVFFHALAGVSEIGGDPFRFMNYGYVPLDEEFDLELHETDERDRESISLYHQLLRKVDTEKKDILEISAGRGGGCEFIAEYLNVRSITALDRTARTVELMKQRHQQLPIQHHCGRAESTGLAACSFDIVLNVESAHCYSSLELFFREVHRLLRPDGCFLFCDSIPSEFVDQIGRLLEACEFEIVEMSDITDNVMESLRRQMAYRSELLEKARIPHWIFRTAAVRKVIKNMLVTDPGSDNYQALVTGKESYVSIVAKKSSSRTF